MALDLKSFESESLKDYVEKALEAMKDDLEDKDWGIVGSVLRMAAYCDETKHARDTMDLDGQASPAERIRAMELYNKAVYTIPQIIAGLDKLGGSIASRKALDIKPAPQRSGLAAVRELRASGTDGKQTPDTQKGTSTRKRNPRN